MLKMAVLGFSLRETANPCREDPSQYLAKLGEIEDRVGAVENSLENVTSGRTKHLPG